MGLWPDTITGSDGRALREYLRVTTSGTGFAAGGGGGGGTSFFAVDGPHQSFLSFPRSPDVSTANR